MAAEPRAAPAVPSIPFRNRRLLSGEQSWSRAMRTPVIAVLSVGTTDAASACVFVGSHPWTLADAWYWHMREGQSAIFTLVRYCRATVGRPPRLAAAVAAPRHPTRPAVACRQLNA